MAVDRFSKETVISETLKIDPELLRAAFPQFLSA